MRKTEYVSRRGQNGTGVSQEAGPSASSAVLSVSDSEEGFDFRRYRNDPEGFARNVLGSSWWQAQREIARLLATHRRVAVKAANGVGKTYLKAVTE